MANRPPERQSLTIDGPVGPLEGVLEIPRDREPRGVGVFCHPHPLHGGTMTNKVVHTLARAATECGFAALRFNFRGVGASAGEHDDGRGEVDDAAAVVAEARRRYAGTWLLGGFSFGSLVAMQVARRTAPALLVSIAPPVGRLPSDFSPPECPWLIVQGDQDELVDSGEVAQWVRAMARPPELIEMHGVSHFFHGRLTELREHLVRRIEALRY